MTREQRRLTTIISIDVVGYSRLMGRDDQGTTKRWKALRTEVLAPKIAEYGGRIVNTAGDNQLVEFPSVVDAVRCAVDVQRTMATRNTSAPADQRMDLRIGINVGDIVVDGDQIFGDGVNVAARVQALAPPGGICASKVVRDQVLDKLNFAFEDLGAQEVKNIARPVEVYRVDFSGALPASAQSGIPPRFASPIGRWLGVGVVAIALAAIAMWTFPHVWRQTSTPQSLRVAVAVLPFAAPGGSAPEEQLADGLTRDVTAALASNMRMTGVVSADLVASYKGKQIDPYRAGRELDASYLVEGEVRRVDDLTEVNARLIDASKGTQLWSERLEIARSGGPKDIALLLARLTDHIEEGVRNANFLRFSGPPAPNASPLELTIHGYSILYRNDNSLPAGREARKWFDQALRRDPNFQSAMTGRLETLATELDMDPKADYSRILAEMDSLSARAVGADNSNPGAWGQRAWVLVLQQRWDAALEANAKQERLIAGAGWGLLGRAWIMLQMGRPQDALNLTDQHLARDPSNQIELGFAMEVRCRAFMALGRYDEAIAACEKGVALDDSWRERLYLVAGYALKGNAARANAEADALLKLRPGTSIVNYKRLYWSDNPAFVQQTEAHLITGLRKAGFPEE
jgi:class 3 adenylate cyclase/TolB-like protein